MFPFLSEGSKSEYEPEAQGLVLIPSMIEGLSGHDMGQMVP